MPRVQQSMLLCVVHHDTCAHHSHTTRIPPGHPHGAGRNENETTKHYLSRTNALPIDDEHPAPLWVQLQSLSLVQMQQRDVVLVVVAAPTLRLPTSCVERRAQTDRRRRRWSWSFRRCHR